MAQEVLQLCRLSEYYEDNHLEVPRAERTSRPVYKGLDPLDRVTVSLFNGGHEQDVKAMLELYDHPEELTFPDAEVSDRMSASGEGVDKCR